MTNKSRGGRSREDPPPMSIVCMHVIDHGQPILLVWRDREDEGVGLACGRRNHDPDRMDEWGMAHTFHFLAHDRALGIVHTLRPGESALRERPGSPWRRFRGSLDDSVIEL